MTNIDLERLKDKAIEEAVNGRYQNAIDLNLQILKLDPLDIDSMMQLAHAHWQTGNLSEAKKYYRKTIDIEPNNNLAKKRLVLLNALNHKVVPLSKKRSQVRIVPITDLIEEPGKTKIVKLSNIGKPEHLSLLKIGEELFIKIRKRRIEMRDADSNFIGSLPDDISKRLIEFVSLKATFEAFVFSIDKNEVKAFLKEADKPLKLRNVSSFISEDIKPELEDEENEAHPEAEADLDLDNEKIILTPEEVIGENPPSRDEEEDEEDEDKETYQEYEE